LDWKKLLAGAYRLMPKFCLNAFRSVEDVACGDTSDGIEGKNYWQGLVRRCQ